MALVRRNVLRNKLFRYTNLAAAIHLLRSRQLTLLSYSFWDDHNDRLYMDHYKTERGLTSLLALCFTMQDERYHHWSVFAPRMDGVRLHFKVGAFVSAMRAYPGVRMDSVDYKRFEDMEVGSVDRDDLPFIKRYPYQDEKEWRIIWSGHGPVVEAKPFDIPLQAISQITLSPWLPPTLFESMRDTIKSIDGCSRIPIKRSTLIKSDRWANFLT